MWEDPIAAQIAGVRHDERTIDRVAALLAEPEQKPDTTTRARVERQMRDLALDVARGEIDDQTYLARMATLRASASGTDAATSSNPSVFVIASRGTCTT